MSENNITEQLKKVASDVLSEETLQGIEDAFTKSVQEKSEELSTLRVEKALIEQDEAHAVKLEKLLEAIDTDHTSKLHKVVAAIDKNHSSKLVSLVEKFKKELDNDAGTFKESVVDNISNYLDLYVEKAIPTQDVAEAVKNSHAVSILENLRKTLSIDNAMSNESIREAVIDGKKQIDERSNQAAKLQQENKLLKENLEKQQAKVALEQHTSGMPSVKKRHIEKVFAGKSAQFIKENYQFTLDMFDKSETEKLQTLKEQATADKQVAERPVRERQKIVQESVEAKITQSDPSNMQDSNLFTNYMEELNRT